VDKRTSLIAVSDTPPSPRRPDGRHDLAAVYRLHRAEMVRLAYLIVRSPALAEELTQEAFIRLQGNLDDVENPPAFVRTALVRLCLTAVSRQRAERDRLERLAPTSPVPEPEVDEMWDALGRLSPDRRTALVLRYYGDLDYAEIAGLMGTPVATARTRVHRGLADLRKEIER
jgi:RNA polymerase sigma factor (sigma-70 family)